METRSSSGELTLAAFAPVPRLPWSVLIQEPSASAFAPLQNLTTQAIVYVSGIMLIAALLGIALARRIVRPVRELARGTEEIGKGNLDYQIEITSADEIGQLAQSFNRMTRDLRAITASRDELNREIAERKQAEEKLQIFAAELERSNKELEQFAYIASHDLQEPLRMVASYSQLLEKRYRGKLDQDANEYIGFAVDGVNRMQRLINDLLAYSRISTRGKEFTPVDCHAVVGQVIANLQIAIQETGALVTCDPLPTVRADESQMIQLFQNLIGNAIKFHGTEPPRVHISARETFEVLETSKVWTFSIRDNGIGIAPQYRERIFVIFQRLHTREEYSGTGIGLAICKKIVERHNGRIWVESEPGKGATFYFTLPAN
ncbi:MAG: HAMP domain-containing protein [Chloroflexi bacterium]|nr:HAMP domain-containing protein [Chloroflexota bacterium]